MAGLGECRGPMGCSGNFHRLRICTKVDTAVSLATSAQLRRSDMRSANESFLPTESENYFVSCIYIILRLYQVVNYSVLISTHCWSDIKLTSHGASGASRWSSPCGPPVSRSPKPWRSATGSAPRSWRASPRHPRRWDTKGTPWELTPKSQEDFGEFGFFLDFGEPT